MDNGILQRDQASKIKRIVGQTKWKKGRRHLISTPQAPQDLNMEPGPSSLAFPSPCATQHLNGWNGAVAQEQSHLQVSETDMSSFIDPAWSTSSHNDIFTIESMFNQEGYAPAPTPSKNKDVQLTL
jgi:hypothetical protein